VLSAYMRTELVDAGVPADRIRIVPPAVRSLPADGPADGSVDGSRCVLFAGRLVEAKGVWDAVEAWRTSDLELPLVLAGTGPLRPQLEAAGLNVTGWLSRAALARLYRRAAVVLMPSRWQEPFGIVGLEALSLGVPVAAWESGGVAEWHPARDRVAWGDLQALAATARRLAHARASAPDGFGPDAFTDRLEALFSGIGRRP
jgi:glycosyltransferase involved in cell wall biosynthesis